MSLQAIIEVAIGLIFAWLVLSLASMFFQEWLVNRLKWRSTMLEATIRNLLADEKLARQFYDHPLIKGLHSGENGKNRPSYIPSDQFALALFDIVLNAGKTTSILQRELYGLRNDIDRLQKDEKARAEAQYELVLAAARKALNTQAGDAALQNALENVKLELGILGKVNPLLQTAIEETISRVEIKTEEVDALLKTLQKESSREKNTLEQLRDGVAVLSASQPQLKQALESLLTGAEEYVKEKESALALARQNVEKWFNDSMDRLSGWYKRRAQQTGLYIGIAVAVLLNADTLQLAQTLWREPLIREALVAQANTYVEQNPEGLQPGSLEQLAALQLQFSNINIPIGWIGSPLPMISGNAVPQNDGSQKLCTFLPRSSVEIYGLPFGQKCYPIINAPQINDLTGIVLKIFGLFASGLAAAQGAPFWFDILKKFMNIRTSGANPNEATK